MHPYLKSNLSKINFQLGRNPLIEQTSNFRKFIPAPYQAVFTLSADFELAWAWRFSKGFDNPLRSALEKARLARQNVPRILELCDTYQVPITWATVGHLFLESCSSVDGRPHPELERLPHFENGYWKFSEGDWFRDDPCGDYRRNPEWYCPDLLDQIQASSVKHEIGCHTFSHIDCRDGVCPPEVFASELKQCRALAEARGVDLKTFIYPAHTVGNLDLLPCLGFTNYRTNLSNTLGYPVKHPNGLWETKSTFQLEYRPDWSLDYHIFRAKKIIDRAIKSRTLCHFWFHPSFDPNYLETVLPPVLSYLNERRHEIMITTMDRHVAWLEEVHTLSESSTV